MTQFDYSKLLGLIREKGFTQETLAASIGISGWSLNMSLNNKRQFKQNEIFNICYALDISLFNIMLYFFTHKVLIL